jgi:hypothetical protein
MSDHATTRTTLTSTCDRKGACAAHPQIRLRRRNALTGKWATILEHCPMCAVECMKRLSLGKEEEGGAQDVMHRQQHSRPPRAEKQVKSSSSVHSSHSSSSSSKRRSISKRRQLNDEFSASTSSITADTVLSSSSHSSATSYSDSHVVCGMEYSLYTSNGAKWIGYYTGQVEDCNDLPHGIGTMRCHDGRLLQGEWRLGQLVDMPRMMTTEPMPMHRNEYAQPVLQLPTLNTPPQMKTKTLHPPPLNAKSVRFQSAISNTPSTSSNSTDSEEEDSSSWFDNATDSNTDTESEQDFSGEMIHPTRGAVRRAGGTRRTVRFDIQERVNAGTINSMRRLENEYTARESKVNDPPGW